MIEVRRLRKSFGSGSHQVTVLDGIDLSVANAEICAVVGPSGAGKTTLARCLNLLESPSGGSVTVDGRELTGLSSRQLRQARRAIGTVFQSSTVLTRRTAAQNVALPLEFLQVTQRQKDARVAELLDRVGLGDRAGLYPHQLSGGQRQRVGIARALALRPSVLLADEATSGLDPDTTESIVELLRELRADLGLTILAITHDMALVRHLADRVARLDRGRIVEQGRLVDLLTDPGSALGSALLPRPASTSAPGEWQVTYRDQRVAADWVTRLGGELGAPVQLRAASVETVGGVPVGRATIRVDHPDAPRIPVLLARWGLHAEAVTPALPASDLAGERAEVPA